MLKLDIQKFSDGKIVIDTELNSKNFENGLSKIQNTTQKAGTSIKNIVAGLGITKLIGVAMSEISGSIDGAVKRVDTLNNFPKVMSNLGIASDDADKSIKKMSDKLAGLPTTLDQGASAVQRFTSANGDVQKSTDIFLALNNAILAGGASSEIQASALEQLSQSYAKGKPDMMEWRTAMTAMPAQLKQVATAMGYVDADSLGEALRKGEVSMDDFMETVTKLNTKGVNGFKSFEEQARNSTGGIGTSIQVAKTQVVKGVADIVESLNVKLQDIGLGSLSDIIANIGKKSKEALDTIAGIIKGDLSIGEVVEHGGKMISSFMDTITENLPKVIEIGMKMFSEFVNGFVKNLPDIIVKAVDMILAFVQGIIDNIDTIIDAGINMMIALAEGLIDALPRLIKKIPEIIEKLVAAIIRNSPKIVDAGMKIIVMLNEGLLKAIPQLLAKIPSMVWNIGVTLVKGIGNGLLQTVGWLKQRASDMVNNVINVIKNLPAAMLNVGINVVRGIWSGISGSLSWIKNKISGWVGNVLNFIKKLFGIHSPSTVMRDEVGKYLAQGMGVGFDNELDNVYKDMQKAIDIENGKMQANVQTGKVFNTVASTTPVYVQVDAEVEMDKTKVGRIITPVVSETLKTGGLR
jgi:tape measure domain-containing protein